MQQMPLGIPGRAFLFLFLKEARPAGFVQTWWVGTVSRDRGPLLWPSWRGGGLLQPRTWL